MTVTVNTTRFSMRVVRLADLDYLHPAPLPGGSVFSEAGSTRDPLPIGSTMPGALPEAGGSLGGDKADSREVCPAQPSPARDVPRLPRGQVLQLPLTFDGTEAAYARIWGGNLLLMLFTAGLAWPWAYERHQHFFLEHTQLAGHRFGFRLSARDLWPRLVVMLVLWLGMAGATVGSWRAGMVAMTVGCATWPLMTYLGIDQRVGAVSWAGRRLWFEGPWHGVYRAAALPLGGGVMGGWLILSGWGTASPAGRAAVAGCALVVLACTPLAIWRFLLYRQQHLRLGPLRLRWTATRADVLRVVAGIALWLMLTGLLLAAVMSAVAWAWQQQSLQTLPHRQWYLLWAGAAALSLVLVGPLAQTRLINLTWNKSGNRYLRVRSSLTARAYTAHALGQAVRVVCTLGLYWPWARVARWRHRTESLTVVSRVEPDTLLAYWSSRQSDAPQTLMSAPPEAAAARSAQG